MPNVLNISHDPLKCDHLVIYHWKRGDDGKETETLKCMYCGAYVVDMKRMARMREFAWSTPLESEDGE